MKKLLGSTMLTKNPMHIHFKNMETDSASTASTKLLSMFLRSLLMIVGLLRLPELNLILLCWN